MKAQLTDFGFKWGSAEIVRYCSDQKKSWVILGIETAKYPQGIQVYVTKSGKIRINDGNNEWKPSK